MEYPVFIVFNELFLFSDQDYIKLKLSRIKGGNARNEGGFLCVLLISLESLLNFFVFLKWKLISNWLAGISFYVKFFKNFRDNLFLKTVW